MPENIEKTIYKLELDDSAYTAGVEKLSASTQKFTQSQAEANKKLQQHETALKEISEHLQRAKKDLDSYTGANEKYKKQLQDSVKSATADQAKLTELVNNNRKAYEAATKAAKDFADTASKASNLQPGAGSGKITPPIIPPTVPQGLDDIADKAKKVTGGVTDMFKAFLGASVVEEGIKLITEGLLDLVESIFAASRAQKLRLAIEKDMLEIKTQSLEAAQKERVEISALLVVARDETKTKEERLAVIRKINDSSPEYLGNITLENINTKETNAAIDIYITSLEAKARAQAYISVIQEKYNLLIELEGELTTGVAKQNDFIGKIARRDIKNRIEDINKEIAALNIRFQVDLKTGKAKIDLDKEIAENNKDATSAIKAGNKGLTDQIKKNKKDIADAERDAKNKQRDADKQKSIDDDFRKRKADLIAQISALAETEFQSTLTIKAKYRDKLNKALLDISKGKFSDKQKDELSSLAGNLNAAELEKALKAFNKKVTNVKAKLNEELRVLEEKNNQDNLNLIRDQFDRRAKLIDFNESKELDDLGAATLRKIKDLNDQHKLGLVSESDYQVLKARIILDGEDAANNIIAKAAGLRKDLVADIFKKSLDGLKGIIDSQLLKIDESAAEKIQEQNKALKAGTIGYKQYQKNITAILNEQKEKRDKLRLAELNTELAAINKKLLTVTDEAEKEDLLKKQLAVRGEITNIKSKKADDPNKAASEKTAEIIKYADAIGAVVDSVIQFWAKANEAETKALDRSISIQEKRVEAAQRIASRGNAQYLKQEEDRLKELNVKRENAARKQLGIDAALQASQILVAITGAVAKIANPVPGAGIAETIAAVAIIIGSLATGYGLVKSLQGNQPKLAKGKKYVTRDGHASGVDTIPAWLNEGEAVIPTDRNRAYHPTVAAIYDGTIPADHMNSFVNAYHKVKGVPMPNYNRIGEAAGMSISSDGKMAILLSDNNKKLDESNELSRQTLRAMKSMNVSANIDRDGVAIMVNEYIGKMEIDKKV